jgi:hypothetical protein
MTELLSVECLFGDGYPNAPVVQEVDGRGIAARRSPEANLPAGRYRRYGEHPTLAAHPTSGWEFDGERAVPGLTAPGQGDGSYAGLTFGPEGEIAMRYYSQHERLPLPGEPATPADVFLARFSRR